MRLINLSVAAVIGFGFFSTALFAIPVTSVHARSGDLDVEASSTSLEARKSPPAELIITFTGSPVTTPTQESFDTSEAPDEADEKVKIKVFVDKAAEAKKIPAGPYNSVWKGLPAAGRETIFEMKLHGSEYKGTIPRGKGNGKDRATLKHGKDEIFTMDLATLIKDCGLH
ncbi:hypothetical protein BT96DRAFT_939527 [Gymnopus androsaceus JB14]|uniref:Uncharacterized protein n=1 Tax=Gymnopus androsaceus JB14 TaxID=1447944 RepID=A0A6A4HRB5_9AGAR|nr:hypothetical protein BT96DRAFT_939527 [Gymnopus androsaceus JB14]